MRTPEEIARNSPLWPWLGLKARKFEFVSTLIDAQREAREAALEEAAKACEGQYLPDPPHVHETDDAYDITVRHCAAAIRALKGEAK